jgi:hypothetical protein
LKTESTIIDHGLNHLFAEGIPKFFEIAGRNSFAMELQYLFLAGLAWSYWLKWKLTIQREGDQLMEQITSEKLSNDAGEIYPESETNFLSKANGPFELTIAKTGKGEATAVILRSPGGPVREGKKLKNK